MEILNTKNSRRSFIKSVAVSGGGLMLGFSWLPNAKGAANATATPGQWTEINAFLKISSDGLVTIQCPNPEFGQGVKTSLPMIVAEELDVDWESVVVDQAPFNMDLYTRQFSGGSQSVRAGWNSLRKAGATARHMLRQAAANEWKVPFEEVTTEDGMLHHKKSGKSLSYGKVAAKAASIAVPENPELKNPKEFKIVSSTKKNVDGLAIVTGKPMFGVDVDHEGMLVASIVKPPAFGKKLKSFDAASIRSMPGIVDVFQIQTFESDYQRRIFDDDAFPELVAIVGETTWQTFAAKKALQAEWEAFEDTELTVSTWGGGARKTIVPAGLENTSDHEAKLAELDDQQGEIARKDGEPEAAFDSASKVLDRTYSAPHLAHNAMEPQNFFADVRDGKVVVEGPLQAPQFIEQSVSERLGVPIEDIEIRMTRMGGGFGRRAYCHYVVEAALISQRMKRPVKLVYTREDDMTFGIYRPAYRMRYRAAIDANNQVAGFHIRSAGVPESPLPANRFPAGAYENYLAEGSSIQSNITMGAFRAPRSNFNCAAEQCFLDELAETLGKDPIALRLELLERAKSNPVGDRNDYDAERYAGVLELVREKSNWGSSQPGVSRGVAAYFCHNSYAAYVVDVVMNQGRPVVENVCSAVDCGIVVNRGAAINMVQGAVVDGIGNALFGEMTFKDGAPEKNNFHQYRMIRIPEVPKRIDVHFVENDIAPTGLGEPPFPPIFAALANALYKATGKRLYRQPFAEQIGI